MIDALSATEGGMLNDVQRMHVISHNLANVTTSGFKKERIVAHGFADYLNVSGTDNNRRLAEVPVPGLKVYTDYSSGTLHYTGNPLDVAVAGDGFFVVQTPTGEAYTRQGTFHIDSSGRLVTAEGLPVLGQGGAIRLTNMNPTIDSQGVVHDGATIAGQLQVVSVVNPETLKDIGTGLFAPSVDTSLDTNSSVGVRQGYTEASNVVSMNQMVKLIDTVRHFESSQRVLRSYDNMLDKAINVLGSF